jgi:hypothetical protein
MRTTKKLITAAVAAATLAGGLATATESSAQTRRSHHRDDRAGAAIFAGIAGLALGAAIAGDRNGQRYDYAPPYAYAPYPYAYAPRSYAYRYRGPYARTCVYWRHDRWGRPYRVSGWC